MDKYKISIEYIVTHEKIRHDWIMKHPDLAKEKKVAEKVDITQEEYKRFIDILKTHLKQRSAK